ncbi:polysaccharide deacetylase family protein [Flavobacterium sp.]|uniref:polysaccharide deacetylase family protein n=1 Tax=Flavobacterium sp. TaxID=239 RepID=UPI0012106CFA|nr:polysaccharide deacetylase family protein [Flavobacterium sp.]RZJ72527.1 MAG: polysaccharide deacetylase family protein [Flavobacterium sp.]
MTRHQIVTITFAATAITLALLSLFASLSWWFFGLSIVVWMAIVVVGSAWIASNYHVKAFCSNPSEKENRIAITFDDGPSEFTPKVLELLERFDSNAAFFCIGNNVQSHPDILLKTIQKGHIVGNHSYFHGKDFDWKNTSEVLSELIQTDAAIEKFSGKKPKFFRPPYGVTNPSIANALKVTKHRVIGWNIRSMDGVSKDENAIYERIVKQLKPGAIILMHDTSQITVNVLERLLLTLREKNFTVVSIDKLLRLNAYEEN